MALDTCLQEGKLYFMIRDATAVESPFGAAPADTDAA